jgi:hypothetical protein
LGGQWLNDIQAIRIKTYSGPSFVQMITQRRKSHASKTGGQELVHRSAAPNGYVRRYSARLTATDCKRSEWHALSRESTK